MEEVLYDVSFLDDPAPEATKLTLENAIIFTEALFNKYYKEPNLAITISRSVNDAN